MFHLEKVGNSEEFNCLLSIFGGVPAELLAKRVTATTLDVRHTVQPIEQELKCRGREQMAFELDW